jgi:hypothetical protein
MEIVVDRKADGQCSEVTSRLSLSVRPDTILSTLTFLLTYQNQPIRQLLDILDQMETWIEEAPPLPDSQRFGNKAFRTYISLVEKVLLAFPS